MASETHSERRLRGFTLIEIMVATAILVLMMSIVFSIINQTTDVWKKSKDRIAAYQAARNGFDALSRTLAQATLNTYLAYVKADGTLGQIGVDDPQGYAPYSELHLISGNSSVLLSRTAAECPGHAVFFQAPLGHGNVRLPSLLNETGFYTEYGTDSGLPSFLTSAPGFKAKYRFRLMQFLSRSESLSVYATGPSADPAPLDPWAWFRVPISQSEPEAFPLADNVVLLVLQPVLPYYEDSSGLALLAGNSTPFSYRYDSSASVTYTTDLNPNPVSARHQLPPAYLVTMLALEESSARLLEGSGSTPPDLGFDPSLVFQDARNYASDLQAVENALRSRNIGYRIFNTRVPIKGAKWSAE